MIDIEILKNEVIQGKQITKEEALKLYEAPFGKLPFLRTVRT